MADLAEQAIVHLAQTNDGVLNLPEESPSHEFLVGGFDTPAALSDRVWSLVLNSTTALSLAA